MRLLAALTDWATTPQRPELVSVTGYNAIRPGCLQVLARSGPAVRGVAAVLHPPPEQRWQPMS